MTTDGNPQGIDSVLARPMAWLAKGVLRFPVATIALAVIIALGGAYLSVTKLGYRTNRLDLLNPGHEFNRIWIDYLKEFGEADDAVVVVEGNNREQVIPVLQELANKLSRDSQLFHAVLHKIDLTKIRAKGLHYLPATELAQVEQFMELAAPILQGQWSLLQVGNFVGALGQPLAQQGGAEELVRLEQLLASLTNHLSNAKQYVSPWPAIPEGSAGMELKRREYLLADNGRFGFVVLRLAPGKDTFAPGSEAIDALRDHIARVQAKHREVQVGLTGLPIMENDEMRCSQSSMTWATLLSLGGVVLVLMAAFGGLRHALLANLVLVIAMGWSFGYATLAVGHLNILSVVFTVTLNGLGIDYGLYYAARYIQKRREGRDCEAALLESIREVGPAIVIGACTTAAGFFAATFTTFTGIAELGLIAGGGILLCLVAQLYVLPAFILVVDRGPWGEKIPEPLEVFQWIRWLMKSPRQVVAFTVAITIMLGVGVTCLNYDYNLLNLQAEKLESVELERRLLNECGQSMWFALSVSDSPEELLARKAQFESLATVERCEEIVSLIPLDAAEKAPQVARIHQQLTDVPVQAPLIAVDQPEKLSQVFGQLQQLAQQTPGGEACARQLAVLSERLRTLTAAECYARMSDFQQRLAGDLIQRLNLLAAVSNPQSPDLTDLPASIVARFVGQSGKHLLRIYGKGNIWDMDGLGRFVADVRGVDPRATGNPLQAYESSREMKHSYELAICYSLLIVVGIIAFDLRSVTWTLLALLPLGMGVLMMLGIMGLLNMPLNPANMIALPLILGVGVDYGLHVIYDYRQRGQFDGISPSTALAVTVDALTTSVGFGSMMIASHQGLQSLGRVLTIGTTTCLCCAIFFLPALLAWYSRSKNGTNSTEYQEPINVEVLISAMEPQREADQESATEIEAKIAAAA